MSQADDLSSLLTLLADAPLEGSSLREIQSAATEAGQGWSMQQINDMLVRLGTQVEHHKLRLQGVKVTKFRIRKD